MPPSAQEHAQAVTTGDRVRPLTTSVTQRRPAAGPPLHPPRRRDERASCGHDRRARAQLDLPAAAARRLRVRRRGRDRPLPRAARRLAPLPLADPAGDARIDARLRRRRPHARLGRPRRARRDSRRSRRPRTRTGSASSSTSSRTTWPCPTPEYLNRPFWEMLRLGRDAPTAHWFDIDWEAGDGRIGLPFLGAPLEELIAQGELSVGEHDGEPVLRYADHRFPLAPGSETGDLAALLAQQHYALASWRDKDAVLNYRRFFDVDTLIAIRVELDDVFDATHAVLIDLHREGIIDGFRIDHPDGLADPQGYLERLRERDRRRLGRRRGHPRAGRVAARRVAVRGHDGLRRDARDPGRRRAAGRARARRALAGRGRRAVARARRDRGQEPRRAQPLRARGAAARAGGRRGRGRRARARRDRGGAARAARARRGLPRVPAAGLRGRSRGARAHRAHGRAGAAHAARSRRDDRRARAAARRHHDRRARPDAT